MSFMNDRERFYFFGKCCWTCGNKDCRFSQINGQPPHESGEGKNCPQYERIDLGKPTFISAVIFRYEQGGLISAVGRAVEIVGMKIQGLW